MEPGTAEQRPLLLSDPIPLSQHTPEQFRMKFTALDSQGREHFAVGIHHPVKCLGGYLYFTRKNGYPYARDHDYSCHEMLLASH